MWRNRPIKKADGVKNERHEVKNKLPSSPGRLRGEGKLRKNEGKKGRERERSAEQEKTAFGDRKRRAWSGTSGRTKKKHNQRRKPKTADRVNRISTTGGGQLTGGAQ